MHGAASPAMEILLLALAIGFIWMHLAKPIRAEARRQLLAEIEDARATLRWCDAELAKPDLPEATKQQVAQLKQQRARMLRYLERKLNE